MTKELIYSMDSVLPPHQIESTEEMLHFVPRLNRPDQRLDPSIRFISQTPDNCAGIREFPGQEQNSSAHFYRYFGH